jgi:hypothetical protein
LIPVMILVSLPISPAGQDLFTKTRFFEFSSLEDNGVPITISAVANVPEGLHFTFQMKEALEGRDWKGEIRFGPWGSLSDYLNRS